MWSIPPCDAFECKTAYGWPPRLSQQLRRYRKVAIASNDWAPSNYRQSPVLSAAGVQPWSQSARHRLYKNGAHAPIGTQIVTVTVTAVGRETVAQEEPSSLRVTRCSEQDRKDALLSCWSPRPESRSGPNQVGSSMLASSSRSFRWNPTEA